MLMQHAHSARILSMPLWCTDKQMVQYKGVLRQDTPTRSARQLPWTRISVRIIEYWPCTDSIDSGNANNIPYTRLPNCDNFNPMFSAAWKKTTTNALLPGMRGETDTANERRHGIVSHNTLWPLHAPFLHLVVLLVLAIGSSCSVSPAVSQLITVQNCGVKVEDSNEDCDT